MLSDEVTCLFNVIQLFKIFWGSICLHCHIYHPLNYCLRAAAECISHYCTGSTEQYLQVQQVNLSDAGVCFQLTE